MQIWVPVKVKLFLLTKSEEENTEGMEFEKPWKCSYYTSTSTGIIPRICSGLPTRLRPCTKLWDACGTLAGRLRTLCEAPSWDLQGQVSLVLRMFLWGKGKQPKQDDAGHSCDSPFQKGT